MMSRPADRGRLKALVRGEQVIARSAAAGVPRGASEEDWAAATDELVAQARAIEGKDRLGFYDLHRRRYAEANPTPEAGEFQIGLRGGRLARPAGEFKGHADRAGERGRWGLHPHLEVFGDGKAALRDAIDAGILDVLVASREEFARR